MNDPEVAASSLLRAIRAEARQQAHTEVRDRLVRWEQEAAERAKDISPARPSLTAGGREAAMLRRLVERLDRLYPQPGEQWSEVVGLDSVEVWFYPGEPEEPEPEPIRIVVIDGCENVAAAGYLSLADARTHAEDLLRLIERIEEDRAAAERASVEAAARGADTPDPAVLAPVQSGE